MLGSLYERMARENDEMEREKKRPRRTKGLELLDNTPEADLWKDTADRALLSVRFYSTALY